MAEEKKKTPKRNHLISRSRVREFVADHPGAKKDVDALYEWCSTVKKADWRNFADVRNTFATASQVGDQVCFNVGDNKYRIFVGIDYRDGKPAWVYVDEILTHSEYDERNKRNR